MIAKAKLRYLRVSPTKVNQVIRVIRGRSVGSALNLLRHVNKGVSNHIYKLVKSALTNAQNKPVANTDPNSIYISKAVVNCGPTLKRFKAAAFGRAVLIQKKTSHIEIELDSKPLAPKAQTFKVSRHPKPASFEAKKPPAKKPKAKKRKVKAKK